MKLLAALLLCWPLSGLLAGAPSAPRAAKPNIVYLLATDPGETTHLVTTHRGEAQRLATLLQRQIATGRSTPGPDQLNDVAVQLPELSTLTSLRSP